MSLGAKGYRREVAERSLGNSVSPIEAAGVVRVALVGRPAGRACVSRSAGRETRRADRELSY